MKGKKLAVLVGGAPAPGMNAAIRSCSIEAVKRGMSVAGIYGGYSGLIERSPVFRDLSFLSGRDVRAEGGCVIGTSKANPARDRDSLRNTVETLAENGVDCLIAIGGDDTLYATAAVCGYAARQGCRLSCAFIPKTIDNDIPLPDGVRTLGFETAREEGARIVASLIEDAKTEGKWFLVISMGMKTGHLALGIGKAAQASLTLIPEEFAGLGDDTFEAVCETLAGSVIKLRNAGYDYGLAVLSEGLFHSFVDPAETGGLERDGYGSVRLSEIDIGGMIKRALGERLASYGLAPAIVTKRLGYDVRCASPCPYDAEYARDLGYGAVDFLASGGTGALVSVQNGVLVPVPFRELIDPMTRRVKTRYVNPSSLSFRIAREYMVRLESGDLEDKFRLCRLARVAGLAPDRFLDEFRLAVLP